MQVVSGLHSTEGEKGPFFRSGRSLHGDRCRTYSRRLTQGVHLGLREERQVRKVWGIAEQNAFVPGFLSEKLSQTSYRASLQCEVVVRVSPP